MVEFRYEAVDSKGVAARGKVQAPDAAEARKTLRDRSLLPISVEPTGEDAQPAQPKSLSGFNMSVGPAALSRITRQLATLLANDIRVEDALMIIIRQGAHPKMLRVLNEVRKQIIDGQSFAASLASQGRYFPRPYVAAIAAGESSGRLDVVLQYLAEHTEAAWTNRRTIAFALIYPGFLAIVSGLIITLLMTQVVPDILGVYQRRGSELPLMTKILIGISEGMQTAWPAMLALFLALFALAAWFTSTPSGNLAIAARVLRLPVIGPFLKQKHAAQIASTLAILVQSGVPLVRALKIASEASGNAYVRQLFRKAATEVGEGSPLDAALARTGVLPQMMLSMIAGGIRSGELGAALAWTGRDEQSSLDRKIKALTALIEPLILLVMGGMILFIVLAILTPITRLTTMAGS